MADYGGAAAEAKTAYEAAADGDYVKAANAAYEAAKKSGIKEAGCGGAVAESSLGGAAAGAAAGAVIGPLGALIGAGIGALAGGISTAVGCDGPDEAPSTQKQLVDDVGFPAYRPPGWTPDKNESELAKDNIVVSPRGLTLGTVLHLMRRTRELGGGARDYRRIVRVLVNDAQLQRVLRQQAGVELIEEPSLAPLKKLGPRPKVSPFWDLDAILLLQRAGWDLPSLQMLQAGNFERLEGQPSAPVAAWYAELQRLLANFEAMYSPRYSGKLRNIFARPKRPNIVKIRQAIADDARRRAARALTGTTRSLTLDGATTPLLLVLAGAAAWYFLRKKGKR